jgi:hypothetical protein
MNSNSAFWTGLGETVCAPLYFSLCHWIRQRSSEQEIRRILFLARDGLVLKKTWEALYGDDSETELVYLWASRRCLRIAGMETFGDREKAFILSLKNLSPAQCLHQLGLELPDPGAASGLDWNRPMRSKAEKDAFLAYLESVSETILGEAREERTVLLGYLDSLGLLKGEKETVGLVDLGWQGNLQAALQNLLTGAGSKAELQGFYMGTIAPVAIEDRRRTEGLFFHHSEPGRPYRTIRYCRLLVEFLFAAPHPSVKRIRQEGDSFRPEYVAVNEHADVQDSLDIMQAAALARICDNKDQWERTADQIQRDGLRELARLLREPTPAEARILGDVEHFGGFGQALDLYPLARPEATPFALWQLRNQYRKAYWRKGFLTRLAPWQRMALAPLVAGMSLDRA